jgi:aryl-alcohol dehydrogenase-like predicted oxidoreductase
VRPTLRELGTGLVAYSPLGRGYLSGRFTSPDELDVNDWRRTQPRFRRKNAGRNAARGGALRAARRARVAPRSTPFSWTNSRT